MSWKSGNQIRDDIYLHIKNNVWKSSRDFDYVILADADEFLYHEDMPKFLADSKSKGITVFKPEGYWMIADKDYKVSKDCDLLKEVFLGIRGISNDKLVLFDPKLEEINYFAGCHSANPKGDVNHYISSGDLKLLHYKYLGLDDFIPKQEARGKRLSDLNKMYGLGLHYLLDADTHRKEYDSFVSKRVKVI